MFSWVIDVLKFILVVLLLVALYQGYRMATENKVDEVDEADEVDEVHNTAIADQRPQEQQQQQQDFQAVVENDTTYELVDYVNPKLKVGTTVLHGTRSLVVWDSARVNQLRRDFRVSNVLDRMTFEQDTTNVIDVYRAVSDNVYTYVFPNAQTDELIQLKSPTFSDDPTESTARQQNKKPMGKTVDTTTLNIPPELIAKVQELEKTYTTRQSSSGPRAIDTHSSSPSSSVA